MGSKKPIQENRHGLFHFVALIGPAGASWVSAFANHEAMEGTRRSEHSVHLMRRGQLEEAEEELVRVDARRSAIAEYSQVYGHVLDRFYFGALAFLVYGRGDLDLADRLIVQANSAIERSVQLCPVLFPYAHQCLELRLQRARIARNFHHWDLMTQHVEACFAIAEGTAPLCRNEDGSSFDYAELRRRYEEDHGVDPSLPDLKSMLETTQRRRILCDTLRFIYTSNETVIQYP